MPQPPHERCWHSHLLPCRRPTPLLPSTHLSSARLRPLGSNRAHCSAEAFADTFSSFLKLEHAAMQVVWKSTTSVGCAYKTCNGEVLYSCNYYYHLVMSWASLLKTSLQIELPYHEGMAAKKSALSFGAPLCWGSFLLIAEPTGLGVHHLRWLPSMISQCHILGEEQHKAYSSNNDIFTVWQAVFGCICEAGAPNKDVLCCATPCMFWVWV